MKYLMLSVLLVLNLVLPAQSQLRYIGPDSSHGRSIRSLDVQFRQGKSRIVYVVTNSDVSAHYDGKWSILERNGQYGWGIHATEIEFSSVTASPFVEGIYIAQASGSQSGCGGEFFFGSRITDMSYQYDNLSITIGTSSLCFVATERDTAIYRIHFSPWVSRDGGLQWTMMDGSINVPRSSPSNVLHSTTLFSASGWNQLYFYSSNDEGRTWQEFAQIQTSSRNPIFFVHGDRLIVGTNDWIDAGGVFVSFDKGSTWRRTLWGSNVTGMSVVERNPNIVFAAIRDSLFRSIDGGQTWRNILKMNTSRICGLKAHPNGDTLYIASENDGVFELSGSILDVKFPSIATKELLLESNYPNPFSSSTTFRFFLPQRGIARLQIFDIWGRLVVSLEDNELEPGYHERQWSVVHNPGGLYIAQLQSNGRVVSKYILHGHR